MINEVWLVHKQQRVRTIKLCLHNNHKAQICLGKKKQHRLLTARQSSTGCSLTVYEAPTLFLLFSPAHIHTHFTSQHLSTCHTHLSCDDWHPSVLWAHQSSISRQEKVMHGRHCGAWLKRAELLKHSWGADQDSNPQHCYCTLGKWNLCEPWWRDAVFVTPWFPFPHCVGINSLFNKNRNHYLIIWVVNWIEKFG